MDIIVTTQMRSLTDLYTEYGPIMGAGVVAVYLLCSLWSWYRLREFDGPWLAKHSYLWLVRALTNGKFHKTLPELHVKFGEYLSSRPRILVSRTHRVSVGSTFRVGPNDLVTNDPELLRRMAGVRGTRTYGRSNWYNTQEFDSRGSYPLSSIQHDVANSPPIIPARSVFSDTDTKRHDRYKAAMSLGYSGKDVPSLESDVDDVILTFMKVLERDHLSTDSETRVTDFALLCQFFTLDAISKLGFGKAIGHLELNADRFGYIKAIETMLPIITAVSASPLATAITDVSFTKKLLSPSPKDASGMGPLLRYATLPIDSVDDPTDH